MAACNKQGEAKHFMNPRLNWTCWIHFTAPPGEHISLTGGGQLVLRAHLFFLQ